MSNAIAFWLNYFGGADIAYVACFSIACTQVVKVICKANKIDNQLLFRMVSYATGVLSGLEFLGGIHGAMVGFAVAGAASAAYFGVRSWLGGSDVPWRRAIAHYMSGELK